MVLSSKKKFVSCGNTLLVKAYSEINSSCPEIWIIENYLREGWVNRQVSNTQ